MREDTELTWTKGHSLSPISLPNSSLWTVFASILLLFLNLSLIIIHQKFDSNAVLLIIAAFFISGFIADAITGIAHFGFDYIFPPSTPILGPIALEFRNHHDYPTLDPSNFIVNFTKGAYASIPISIVTLGMAMNLDASDGSFLLLTTAELLGVWAFFFHQIHSYAHMGSSIPADVFLERIGEIRQNENKNEMNDQLRSLFLLTPIPKPVRVLQAARIILRPERHNAHHFYFDSNFSSVNGWSDPILNPLLGPIARNLARQRADGNSP